MNVINSSRTLCWYVLAGLVVTLQGCYTEQLPADPTSNYVYPIILVHGFGNTTGVWEDMVREMVPELGVTYGGEVWTENGTAIGPSAVDAADASLFAVRFSDPLGGVADQAQELKSYIDYVRQVTKADKVILVGYSMGGLCPGITLLKTCAPIMSRNW